LSDEYDEIHHWTESFSGENVFGIRQQQHVHCHRKMHTQNAFHNIPYMKTKNNSLQLNVTVTNVDTEVAA
jgi:hypothetical protein